MKDGVKTGRMKWKMIMNGEWQSKDFKGFCSSIYEGFYWSARRI